ncbi:MAG TPA: hypothetical protein VLC53_01240, partial [Myxococcota bacterium]|nr:hypothetical protein [Myxococcota bacterium]
HQAARYRKLSAAWREAEAALLVGRWQVARAALAGAELAVREARDRIDSRGERLSAARAARDRAAEVLPSLRDTEAALAAELARLNERLATLDQETVRVEGARARLVEREQQTVQDLTHARAALADARSMAERLHHERAALDGNAEQYTRALDQAAAAEAIARQEHEDADAQLRHAVTSCAGIEAEIRQLMERRETDDRRRQALIEAQGEARAELAELGAPEDIGALGASIREAEALLTRAAADQDVAEEALRAAEQCREGARAGLSQAAQRLQHRQEQLRAHQERAARVEQERRALAERQGERRQRAARLAERTQELAEKSGRCSARRAALDLGQLEDLLSTAQDAQDRAERQLGAARRQAEATQATEQAQRQAGHEQRARCQRLEAELDALAELADPAAADGAVIGLIEAAAGYAEALAAALGDDLMGALDPGAPVHWRHDVDLAASGTPPGLPDGVPPLSQFVAAPAALARRLCQVGVVEPARAAELQGVLAQGQRLVSRDGGLWRWDGFVRRP